MKTVKLLAAAGMLSGFFRFSFCSAPVSVTAGYPDSAEAKIMTIAKDRYASYRHITEAYTGNQFI